MKDTKTVWFTALRYVVPSDYEQFMENMEAQGWTIKKIGEWSSMKMKFQKTKPRKVRYIFDMNLRPKKDYLQTYLQLGWEYVGIMASCIVWRKAYTGNRPESFSDKDSLVKRNKRFLKAVSVSFFLFLGAFLAVTIAYLVYRNMLSGEQRLQMLFGMAFSLIFVVCLGYVMRKIYKNRRR